MKKGKEATSLLMAVVISVSNLLSPLPVIAAEQIQTEQMEQTEELTEQFEGIYGISWILFTGEKITYEIEEYTEGSWKKLHDGVCSPSEDVRNQTGRYGRVEQIGKSIADGEIFRRNDLLEDYRRESHMAGKLFHLM